MSSDPSGKNRLARASSPYLLLHQDNPVDWYPWGPEALARARREDLPIFVSVGYSTCHWCHVMERESFSDPGIAALMNAGFVNVKVDREERPDLDEVYMAATQILTRQGGWPNSVFLTPELKPFFAGTYFPPQDRLGRPGFVSVLKSLSAAWGERRSEVEEQAESIAGAMHRYLEERDEPAADPPGPGLAQAALAGLEESFDERWGGFGGAPKFPTPSNLLLLLEVAGERAALERLLATTLDRMARGGIYDQLAGGFHRYATDREWKIPHFEKMLYDNGLLLEVYVRRAAVTGDPEPARIARETARFLGREMTSPEGAFWSAVDADSEGREGAYFVWSRDQLQEILGDEDYGFLAPLYGFDGPPFFEGGSWVLHLPQTWADQARRRLLSVEELLEQVGPLRRRLLEARERRPRPGTDDKILTDWNGITVSGLAAAGRLLGEPDLVRRAEAAAEFVLERMWRRPGTLMHSWREGICGVPGFLGDYVFLVRGLLELHVATGADRWLSVAVELTLEQQRRLGDPGGGFFSAGESPDLLFRSQEVFDGAVPGTNAVAGLNLLALAERTGEGRWLEDATVLLRAFAPVAGRVPQAARTLALVTLRHRRMTGAVAAEARETGQGVAAESPKVGGRLEIESAAEEVWRPFRLYLSIEPGWHVHPSSAEGSSPQAPGVRPTEILGRGLELRRLVLPPPTGRVADAQVWEGMIEISGEIRLLSEDARLVVDYQPCDDRRCLPPAALELRPA